jgi:tripartite-type tricarboxylate transporter receptor subunit TctC
LALTTVIALASPAHAQSDYPTKPITLVIPLPPGGTNDIMARAVADKMSALLGQQIVVENRAAAGSGTVTSRAVAHGPADGYTIMLGYTSTLATGPHIFPDVGYDVRKDFTPIGSIGMAPALIVVHPSVPYRTIADLIAAMKASKEPFQVGTPGVSTVNHLSALLFAEQAGVKLQYIPYKGSQPLNTDLIGGFVKVGFNPIPVSRAAIEGNLTRALAATSLKRSAAFPDLPTVAESGLPGYDAVLTYGLVAPGGTPRPIIDKLSKALREVLATDEVKKRLAQEGAEPMSTSPEEYAAVIDREDTKWSAIIKSAGIKAK